MKNIDIKRIIVIFSIITICLAPNFLQDNFLHLKEADAAVMSIHIYGYVNDSVTKLPVPEAKITVYAGDVYTTYTSVSGDYSIWVTASFGSLIKVKAEKWGYKTKSKTFYAYEGSYQKNFGRLVDKGNRIAVFFYDDAAYKDYHIEEYSDVLGNLGYEIRKYRRPACWRPYMSALDDDENTYDRVFIFIGAHGGYYSSSDRSYALVRCIIYSDDFKDEVADLDSQRITVMVCGCYVGDFKDELASLSGVTVMVSSKETESADTEGFPNNFFRCIEGWWIYYGIQTRSIQGAFERAKNDVKTHTPMIDYGAKSFEYF